jgi:nucleoside-diphosphate-sugar epimerase
MQAKGQEMVLLIGATGFLGPSVVEKLLQNNYSVTCLVRKSSNTSRISKLEETAKKAGKKISLVTGNLEDADSIIPLLEKVDIAVYMVDLELTELLENFLYAARHTGLKRAVFISSTTVLVPLESTVKEQKLKSEELIKNSGLCYTILRPSMIYGSEDDNNFSRMIKFIKKRGFFVTFGKGNNLIQPIYIKDVAEAVLSILNNSKTYNKLYNIAGKEPIEYNRMLEIVRNKLKKRFIVIRVPVRPARFLISIYAAISKNPSLTPDQIERMGVDKAYSYKEAARDFIFSPSSFEEGIEKLIKELD